jgi:hypothetical protein
LTIDDVTVTEHDTDETSAVFTLRLSWPSGLPVTVRFATTNGSAVAGLDYVATNGVVTFAPGETNVALPIPVLGDLSSESNEFFSVLLSSPTNALLADAVGRATILDNDGTGGGSVFTMLHWNFGFGPLLSLERVGDIVRFRFLSQFGESYRLEWSDTLQPDAWQPVSESDVLGSGFVVELQAPLSSTPTQRFYRLRVLP